MRVGIGHDTHRLVDGVPLVLGCVSIDHGKGLEGHSDGDVIAHAIADAALGAAALGDLGEHFPATEEWKNASGDAILDRTRTILRASGWTIGNVDVSVMVQSVRIAPHREEMRKRIALALGVQTSQVSVKATTTDGLDAVGRDEGASATAVVTIQPLG